MHHRLPHPHSSHSSQVILQSHAINPILHLDTNAYSVENTKILLIHKYLLTRRATSENTRNVTEEMLQRNHITRAIRRHIMHDIVPQLTNPVATSRVVLGWSLEALYSTEILKSYDKRIQPSDYDDTEFLFKRQKIWANATNFLYLDICLKRMDSFQSNSPEHRYELLSSILHHRLYLDMIKYGAVYFAHPMPSQMENKRVHLISKQSPGISLSNLQTCEDNSTIIVINSPVAYLTESHRLIDIVASVVYNQPVYGVFVETQRAHHSQFGPDRHLMSISLRNEDFQLLKRHLDGYKCQANLNVNLIELRCNLSNTPASEALCQRDDGTSQPLVEYYRSLGVNLTYPNLPCLLSSRNQFIPIELCILEAGQKTPIFRLGQSATQELIKSCKQKPNDSKHFSDGARDEILAISQPNFDSFGIKLNHKNVTAKGSSIGKPMLQFKDNYLTPNRDYWESCEFYESVGLNNNWCVINATSVDDETKRNHIKQTYERDKNVFFQKFAIYCKKFGFDIATMPYYYEQNWRDINDFSSCVRDIIDECQMKTNNNLKLVIFVIGPSVSNATRLNRLIHLNFDDNSALATTCLRFESITNYQQHNAIFRTLVHKLNARMGGINVTYNHSTLSTLNLIGSDLLIIGLDVTHPDNELKGVSIVGCAFTYSGDLFKHKSLVWPQTARTEIIGKIDVLMRSILANYMNHNDGKLPKHVVIYRDGVSHEEFATVEEQEMSKAQRVIEEIAEKKLETIATIKPRLSYIIAQKRHTMRFYQAIQNNYRQMTTFTNPPSGTLIDEKVVSRKGSEFYLYSNISNHTTSRPLHYHVLLDGLGLERLQKLTYYLSFNYGKCSGTLSMPSSLRYAHNAAYDARSRVLESREFNENKFYTSKFFC